jgi:hypothetical protein
MTKKTQELKQITNTGMLNLKGPPDEVFPLFTPMGEYQWIPGWEVELIHPQTPEPQQGTVFVNSHFPDVKTYWLTISYDTEQRLAIYANVTPDVWIMRLDITCEAGSEDNTLAQMTYAMTSLSDHGNKVLDHMFNQESFNERIAQFEKWINFSLVHGKPMPV